MIQTIKKLFQPIDEYDPSTDELVIKVAMIKSRIKEMNTRLGREPMPKTFDLKKKLLQR
jgi:hypothetical protein